MKINQFFIDESNSEDNVLYIDTPSGSVIITIEDEGLRLSVYSLCTSDAAAFETLVLHDTINETS